MLAALSPRSTQASSRSAGTLLAWTVDTRWSRIAFSIAEAIALPISGRIAAVEGLIDVAGEAEGCRVNVKTALAGEASGTADGSTPSLPTIGFRSRQVSRLGKDRFRVRGDLVVNKATQPVEVTLVECGRGRDADATLRIRLAAAGRLELTKLPALSQALAKAWGGKSEPVVQVYVELDVLGRPAN